MKAILLKIKINNTIIEFSEEHDGDKAVDLFRQRNKEKGEENIDLIIMDLYMVNMDGDIATYHVNIFIFINKTKILNLM